VGIDFNSARLLFHARDLGVSFERTATIGRQGMYITEKDLARILSANGKHPGTDAARHVLKAQGGFAEPLLELVGARSVESFDASDYEKATHVWDMNTPIADSYHNRYSAVIDAGTLEHVFNFPVAIGNCMKMVEPGGHFLCLSPMNNFGGHGFYQFSLELYFRVFSRENGFEIVRMYACEGNRGAPWYEVSDPEAVGARMDFVNSRPAVFMMIAKKTEDVPLFATAPQQSDYVAIWTPGDSSSHERGKLYSIYSALPPALKSAARSTRDHFNSMKRRISPFDPRFVRKAKI
jgi:hypothetical protein